MGNQTDYNLEWQTQWKKRSILVGTQMRRSVEGIDAKMIARAVPKLA